MAFLPAVVALLWLWAVILHMTFLAASTVLQALGSQRPCDPPVCNSCTCCHHFLHLLLWDTLLRSVLPPPTFGILHRPSSLLVHFLNFLDITATILFLF